MNESDKKTVYVNEEVSPDESLPIEQANEEHDAISIKDYEVSSEKDFEEQEIPVEEDLTKLFSQNIDLRSENGYASGGDGGGYASDDASSINTDEILKVDPLYLRLTKFLQSEDGESVANTLKKINNQLELLNANLIKTNTTTQN
tara:strand:+ start:3048 stop:3482 length:435 start_codon:yes stop_codon:yes gene_type:complete